MSVVEIGVMTRWQPKITKLIVIEKFREYTQHDEKFSSVDLARLLNCTPAYVRATLARAGIALPKAHSERPSTCGIYRPQPKPIKKKKQKKRK
jgi:hypothetical protein